MSPFVAEIIGTGLLMLLGNGVVANVLLRQTKGHGSGWIVIGFGWGMAVFIGVYSIMNISGAHINPAVTFGLAVAGEFPWAQVPVYMLAQMIGAAIGTTLVWVHYRPHFEATEDPELKLACFSTGPAIRRKGANFISEVIGTFVLVYGVLVIDGDVQGLGSLGALPAGLLVLAIGLCLGGTTGYAINPARDLAPRIMHSLLPIPNKGSSDWDYSWIPVFGPLTGAAVAALLHIITVVV